MDVIENQNQPANSIFSPEALKSRRGFFKAAWQLGKGATAATAIEAIAGPFEKLSGFLGDFTRIWGEGNKTQRLAVLDRITREILWHPTDPQYKEVLISWLKFNALELYAQATEKPTAATLIRHFLYGNGQSLDITNLYAQSYYDYYQKYGTQRRPWEGPDESSIIIQTPQDAVARYIEGAVSGNLSKKVFPGGYLDIPPKLSQDTAGKVTVKTVLGKENIFYGYNEDMYFALHNYTVDLNGRLKQVNGPVASNQEGFDKYWNVTIDNPTVKLYDRYDWDEKNRQIKTQSTNISQAFLAIMQGIGYKNPESILDLIGRDRLKQIDEIPLTVAHDDGLRLQEFNYAKPYDIHTSVNLDKTITLQVADDRLPNFLRP